MFKISGLFFLGVAVLSGGLLFQTSQSVQRAEHDLRELQSKISAEEESTRILSAEWDYLNRPERLEKLTLENLDMDEVHAEKADFIEGKGTVPEVYMPVIPQMKPQHVVMRSTPHAATVKPSEKIKNAESEKFQALMKSQFKDDASHQEGE